MTLTEIRRAVRRCTLCNKQYGRHCPICTRCPGQEHASWCTVKPRRTR